MSKKLTPWFPPEVKPVRPGVYATDYPPYDESFAHYSFWTGLAWGEQWGTPERAADHGAYPGLQHKRWRGLASAPKGKA